MDELDLKISRRLKKILDRTERLVAKEVGHHCGVALIVFPLGTPEAPNRIVEYQYVCNMPRQHMRDAMDALVKKWDRGHKDVAPHERGLN